MSSWRDRHPVVWMRAHPFVPDSLLAGALFVVSVAGLWMVPDQVRSAIRWHHVDALAVIIVAFQTLPLVWRRRRPDVTLVCVGVATVALYLGGYPVHGDGLPVLIAFFTLAEYRTRERMLWPAVFVFLGVVICLLSYRGKVGLGDFIGNFALFAAAWFIGDNVRSRRARTAALVERAERLEREREANARRAVADERARIARELHDVVAHSMSVMVVQAGAARRVMDRSPAEAKEALLSIEDTGRLALEEMRRLLGVLRYDNEPAGNADRAPQPTISELDSLIEVVREAGLEVSLETIGEPKALASGADLSAFRVVQEALTNTLKHAGPARAKVTVRWTPEHLELEVVDDGRGLAAVAARSEGDVTGHGLVGMRERVALYGGDLDVGPAPGGGFRVRARFPVAARDARDAREAAAGRSIGGS